MTAVTSPVGGSRAVTINGNMTPLIPAGLTGGELMVSWAIIASGARSYNAPTGWTLLASVVGGGANGPGLYVAYRFYVPGDTDPVWTTAGTSDPGAGAVSKVLAYSNAGTPTAGTTYSSGTTTGSNAGPITGVTVSGSGRALALGVWANDYTTQPGTPAGWTNIQNDKSAGTNPSSYGADDQAVSGATTSSVTVNGTPTAAAVRVGVQIAIPEGAQNYTGTLTITSTGTLALGATAETASGSLAVSSTGTLSLGGKPAGVGSLAVSSTGTLSFGTGTPAVKGSLAITSTGTLSLFAGAAFGTLAIISTGTLALGVILATAKGSLAITSTGTLTLGGKPIAKGTLTLTGLGSLLLTGIVSTRVKWWDGTAWRPTTIMYWSGSAWVPATVKVWDGTQWA